MGRGERDTADIGSDPPPPKKHKQNSPERNGRAALHKRTRRVERRLGGSADNLCAQSAKNVDLLLAHLKKGWRRELEARAREFCWKLSTQSSLGSSPKGNDSVILYLFGHDDDAAVALDGRSQGETDT